MFKNDLYKIAKARLKNDDDVYDLIQETMIIAFKSIKKLENPLCFKTWIIKILISKSNSMYRKKGNSNVISFDEVENYKLNDYSNIEHAEVILDFNFICKNLNHEDRTIILLYYSERFTDKEIGEILNMKENTVKTKRTRAKQKIKNIMKKGDQIYG